MGGNYFKFFTRYKSVVFRPALCIHGDKNQNERNWVLSGNLMLWFIIISHFLFLEFKAGKVPILLATDVAARGLGESLFLQIAVLCVIFCV